MSDAAAKIYDEKYATPDMTATEVARRHADAARKTREYAIAYGASEPLMKFTEEYTMKKSVTDMSRDALIDKLRESGKAKKADVEKYEEVTAKPLEPMFVADTVDTEAGANTKLFSDVFGFTKLFSDVFGFTPKIGGDFRIPAYEDSYWPEEDHAYIPDVLKFSNFVVPKEVLTSEMRAITNNMKTLVVGPSGSGKTTLQEFIHYKSSSVL